MNDTIMRKLADALALDRKADEPQGASPLDTAYLKFLESSLMARLANMSDDQRTHITNRAIDILRTKNAGWEAEAELRRILSVE
jgi:hypothetical protein